MLYDPDSPLGQGARRLCANRACCRPLVRRAKSGRARIFCSDYCRDEVRRYPALSDYRNRKEAAGALPREKPARCEGLPGNWQKRQQNQ
jgi:hypothetical protein